MAVNNIEGAIKKRKLDILIDQKRIVRKVKRKVKRKDWLFILKKIKPIVIYVKKSPYVVKQI